MIVVLLLVSAVALQAEGTDSPSSSPSKAPNSAAPTSKPVPTPIQRCLFGLANSGFDLFAIEKYNDWMDNETTFELAETGVRKLHGNNKFVTLNSNTASHSCSCLLLFCTTKDLDRAC